MQQRNWWIIGIVVIVLIVGVAYFGSQKSSKTPASTNTPGSSSQNASADVVQTKTDSKLGQYLADANGAALYTYGADQSGVSNCTGSCIANWPAYQAANPPATLPANVTVIKRPDGSSQYAYNGMPLYTFVSDSSGQVTGDGVENFHIAKPAAAPASSSQAPSSSSSGY